MGGKHAKDLSNKGIKVEVLTIIVFFVLLSGTGGWEVNFCWYTRGALAGLDPNFTDLTLL
jgi:hypothetical protein